MSLMWVIPLVWAKRWRCLLHEVLVSTGYTVGEDQWYTQKLGQCTAVSRMWNWTEIRWYLEIPIKRDWLACKLVLMLWFFDDWSILSFNGQKFKSLFVWYFCKIAFVYQVSKRRVLIFGIILIIPSNLSIIFGNLKLALVKYWSSLL